jgi:hypothetical protein
VANDARQQLPQSVQVVVIDDDRESQARRSQSNRDSNLSRKSNAGTQCPPPVTAELETAGLQEACVPDEKSLSMIIKLEPESQLDANLQGPVSPGQDTYLSGTNPSPKSDLPGTNSSPKKTCIAEPDKYRSKKRNRKAQMLRATIDCVFGLWEKDM